MGGCLSTSNPKAKYAEADQINFEPKNGETDKSNPAELELNLKSNNFMNANNSSLSKHCGIASSDLRQTMHHKRDSYISSVSDRYDHLPTEYSNDSQVFSPKKIKQRQKTISKIRQNRSVKIGTVANQDSQKRNSGLEETEERILRILKQNKKIRAVYRHVCEKMLKHNGETLQQKEEKFY